MSDDDVQFVFSILLAFGVMCFAALVVVPLAYGLWLLVS